MEKRPLTAQKKVGLLSSSITAVVVLCLILLNVAAGVITQKYPLKVDLTTNKAFQLSQDSIGYLEGLEKQVQITVLNSREGFVNGGDYYTQAMAVIEQYVQYNPNIIIQFKDILANPAFTSRYPELTLSVNDILVESGGNTERLTAYDIFNVESSWYNESITSSKAEQAVTNAIMNVTEEEKVKVAFLTGHGESGDDGLETLLQKNGFETVRASLLTEGVPSDARIAVLPAPRRDITADEAAALDAFLENSGAYGKYFLYFAAIDQGELPNLESWLAKWGLALGTGAVAETDPSRVVNMNSYFGLADFDDAVLTEKMRTTEIPIAVPFTKPVEFLFTSNLGYSTKTLMSYSAQSGIVGLDTQNVSDIQVSGPIPVAGMGILQKDGQESGVVVFGTHMVLDQSLFESGSLSNADYFLSAFNILTKRENAISIAPKALGGGYIAVTEFEARIWSVLLAIVLPVIALIVGLSIWLRRRRR